MLERAAPAVGVALLAAACGLQDVKAFHVEESLAVFGVDSDRDGLSDDDERARGTLPFDSDSDDDGISDGMEVGFGFDPVHPDTDRDGLLDGAEYYLHQTMVDHVDTDGDRLTDFEEIRTLDSNPRLTHSDHDDIGDGDEVELYGTEPGLTDSDYDGLPDNVEIWDSVTDPLDPDYDRDFLLDGMEHWYGLDPSVHDPGWRLDEARCPASGTFHACTLEVPLTGHLMWGTLDVAMSDGESLTRLSSDQWSQHGGLIQIHPPVWPQTRVYLVYRVW